ncbi:MAG: transposase [Bdellovibrionales bacterium]
MGFKLLETSNIKYFGGAALNKSNPKIARPLSIKRPMHLVMRSSKARGAYSLLNKSREVFNVIYNQGRIHGVKIYRYANAGNHLHIVILPRSTWAYKKFIRSITGLIARLIMRVERGKAKNIKFWDQRPFTRIVEWGRDFKRVSNYLLQNTLEAIGFVAYIPRKRSKYSSA